MNRVDKTQLVLAAMAPAEGALHTPVQIQKLLFLIDRNISRDREGAHFDFRPYYYGPFDREVYAELEKLDREGDVEICPTTRWKTYRLTAQGQQKGSQLLSRLSPSAQAYVTEVSAVVRRMSFSELVSAIYRAYPDMCENSVFQSPA